MKNSLFPVYILLTIVIVSCVNDIEPINTNERKSAFNPYIHTEAEAINIALQGLSLLDESSTTRSRTYNIQ